MNQNNRRLQIAIAAAALLASTACGAATPSDQAPKTVEAYLQARVAGNAEQMIALSCASWEAQARIEASTFKSMNAQLDGVACSVGSTASNETSVQCSGRIVTSYNGENREWRMDERTFRTVSEGGEWRMCGYK